MDGKLQERGGEKDEKKEVEKKGEQRRITNRKRKRQKAMVFLKCGSIFREKTKDRPRESGRA